MSDAHMIRCSVQSTCVIKEYPSSPELPNNNLRCVRPYIQTSAYPVAPTPRLLHAKTADLTNGSTKFCIGMRMTIQYHLVDNDDYEIRRILGTTNLSSLSLRYLNTMKEGLRFSRLGVRALTDLPGSEYTKEGTDLYVPNNLPNKSFSISIEQSDHGELEPIDIALESSKAEYILVDITFTEGSYPVRDNCFDESPMCQSHNDLVWANIILSFTVASQSVKEVDRTLEHLKRHFSCKQDRWSEKRDNLLKKIMSALKPRQFEKYETKHTFSMSKLFSIFASGSYGQVSHSRHIKPMHMRQTFNRYFGFDPSMQFSSAPLTGYYSSSVTILDMYIQHCKSLGYPTLSVERDPKAFTDDITKVEISSNTDLLGLCSKLWNEVPTSDRKHDSFQDCGFCSRAEIWLTDTIMSFLADSITSVEVPFEYRKFINNFLEGGYKKSAAGLASFLLALDDTSKASLPGLEKVLQGLGELTVPLIDYGQLLVQNSVFVPTDQKALMTANLAVLFSATLLAYTNHEVGGFEQFNSVKLVLTEPHIEARYFHVYQCLMRKARTLGICCGVHLDFELDVTPSKDSGEIAVRKFDFGCMTTIFEGQTQGQFQYDRPDSPTIVIDMTPKTLCN